MSSGGKRIFIPSEKQQEVRENKSLIRFIAGVITVVVLGTLTSVYMTDHKKKAKEHARAEQDASEAFVKSYTDDGYTFKTGGLTHTFNTHVLGDLSNDNLFMGYYQFARNDSLFEVDAAFEGTANGGYVPTATTKKLVLVQEAPRAK